MSDATGDAPLMLGVSGLRGITGRSLTPEVAARFAAAFGGWLCERTPGERPAVVVGADGRAGWEETHRAALVGLGAGGCAVTDLGIAMTPSVGVHADLLGAHGGMVITASHNPQEWNGLKCLVREPGRPRRVDACAPSAPVAARIIERFRSAAAPALASAGAGKPGDPVAAHVSAVVAGVETAVGPVRRTDRAVRVVLDSVNGAGRFAGRELLVGACRCEVLHHGAEDTGVFPHAPEPTRDNLQSLCKAVRTFGADAGFAQDPDGDRLAIVDEKGTYIGEEYTLALAAAALLGAEGEPARPRPAGPERVLVANLSTSRMLDDIAARHGARVVRTPVGEANVVEAMKREAAAGADVVLGGEGNGGVIWSRVTYVRDSLSAMALVLALMARTGQPLSALVAGIPAYAIEKRKVSLARREDAARAVDAIARAHGGARVDLQDGVRVDWPEHRAWLHVRPSNTEPILRLIAEAPEPARARAILDEAARLLD